MLTFSRARTIFHEKAAILLFGSVSMYLAYAYAATHSYWFAADVIAFE